MLRLCLLTQLLREHAKDSGFQRPMELSHQPGQDKAQTEEASGGGNIYLGLAWSSYVEVIGSSSKMCSEYYPGLCSQKPTGLPGQSSEGKETSLSPLWGCPCPHHN